MIYVASSWRNPYFDKFVEVLTENGCVVYNFRTDTNFQWQQVDPNYDRTVDRAQWHVYLAMLDHPRSVEGFNGDMGALKAADRVIMLLPCGKSAHLEMGYAVGAGKKTAIYNPESHLPFEPDLMYKMVDLLTGDPNELANWIG